MMHSAGFSGRALRQGDVMGGRGVEGVESKSTSAKMALVLQKEFGPNFTEMRFEHSG